MNGRKMLPADVEVQQQEVKVAAETATMSGPLVAGRPSGRRNVGCNMDVSHVVLRLACLLTSVTAVSLMTTAKQAAAISFYGFHLPVYSKWSFSDSYEYLVGVSVAVAAHSVLQLLICAWKLLRKSPVIPSRNHAWLVFAGDQVFAYAMMSAGSAASGVSNLNRTGIRHTVLPNFCKPLLNFCDRVAASIAFTFFGCFLLATSAILNVVWLSKS
ncbi:CASP-like protein 3A1 [Malania oleifera]|uniref:CASP-like protein 3A1 n=1 Tax=Malania oleifera TaxID=397392 RepID=UPI0025ADD511|nr:CASP-like protein 3A1 [Malania oleifera]